MWAYSMLGPQFKRKLKEEYKKKWVEKKFKHRDNIRDAKTKGILFSLYIKNVRTKLFDKHPLSIITILKM